MSRELYLPGIKMLKGAIAVGAGRQGTLPARVFY